MVDRIGSRGMSNGYAIFLALIGLLMSGFVISTLDQLLMGDMWTINVNNGLNGTIMNIFAFLWGLMPILIVGTALLGIIANSHRTKNETIQ